MYANHFRLSAEPFGLTPDPAYLYPSAGHREALAAVQYGLLDRRGFITLVAAVGTGKTTLLYSLISQLGEEVQAAYVDYTMQSFEELLAAALLDLDVVPTGTSKPALLSAFNAHLLQRADQGHTTALVIDEAQNLSDQTFEELRLLSNFETYDRKLLQIVLVGQPELQERLRQHQLRQLRERVSVRAVINPLSSAEMGRYIEHRLARVGGSAHALFSRAALWLIIRRSAGIPRRANILCHNALLFAFARRVPRVTVGVAREVIAEMDERRPGLLRRRSLRLVRRPFAPARWAIGVGLAFAVVVAAGRIVPRGSSDAAAVCPVRSAPAAPAPPDAIDAPPLAAESPAPADPALTTEIPAPEGDTEGDPVAVASEPMTLTIPPGANLTRLARKIYGWQVGREMPPALAAELQRLNPQLTNMDAIVAGDSIRFPPTPGSTPERREGTP